jgi:hypothetical protein
MHDICALSDEMNFVVAQMKLLILDYIQVDSRHWALTMLFAFNLRTGGLILPRLLFSKIVALTYSPIFTLPFPAILKLQWNSV